MFSHYKVKYKEMFPLDILTVKYIFVDLFLCRHLNKLNTHLPICFGFTTHSNIQEIIQSSLSFILYFIKGSLSEFKFDWMCQI